MTRTVRDAAILLGAMTTANTEDAATQEKRRIAYTDYTPFLDANGLQGARIGTRESVQCPFKRGVFVHIREYKFMENRRSAAEGRQQRDYGYWRRNVAAWLCAARTDSVFGGIGSMPDEGGRGIR